MRWRTPGDTVARRSPEFDAGQAHCRDPVLVWQRAGAGRRLFPRSGAGLAAGRVPGGDVVAAACRCIAVRPDLARLLEAQYRSSIWHYLPNPLGEAFAADVPAAGPKRAGDHFVFLSAARMSPEKGFALLIGAFAEAFGGDPGFRLRLAGDGPIRGDLERLAERRGIARQVEFLGDLPATGV